MNRRSKTIEEGEFDDDYGDDDDTPFGGNFDNFERMRDMRQSQVQGGVAPKKGSKAGLDQGADPRSFDSMVRDGAFDRSSSRMDSVVSRNSKRPDFSAPMGDEDDYGEEGDDDGPGGFPEAMFQYRSGASRGPRESGTIQKKKPDTLAQEKRTKEQEKARQQEENAEAAAEAIREARERKKKQRDEEERLAQEEEELMIAEFRKIQQKRDEEIEKAKVQHEYEELRKSSEFDDRFNNLELSQKIREQSTSGNSSSTFEDIQREKRLNIKDQGEGNSFSRKGSYMKRQSILLSDVAKNENADHLSGMLDDLSSGRATRASILQASQEGGSLVPDRVPEEQSEDSSEDEQAAQDEEIEKLRKEISKENAKKLEWQAQQEKLKSVTEKCKVLEREEADQKKTSEKKIQDQERERDELLQQIKEVQSQFDAESSKSEKLTEEIKDAVAKTASIELGGVQDQIARYDRQLLKFAEKKEVLEQEPHCVENDLEGDKEEMKRRVKKLFTSGWEAQRAIKIQRQRTEKVEQLNKLEEKLNARKANLETILPKLQTKLLQLRRNLSAKQDQEHELKTENEVQFSKLLVELEESEKVRPKLEKLQVIACEVKGQLTNIETYGKEVDGLAEKSKQELAALIEEKKKNQLKEQKRARQLEIERETEKRLQKAEEQEKKKKTKGFSRHTAKKAIEKWEAAEEVRRTECPCSSEESFHSDDGTQECKDRDYTSAKENKEKGDLLDDGGPNFDGLNEMMGKSKAGNPKKDNEKPKEGTWYEEAVEEKPRESELLNFNLVLEECRLDSFVDDGKMHITRGTILPEELVSTHVSVPSAMKQPTRDLGRMIDENVLMTPNKRGRHARNKSSLMGDPVSGPVSASPMSLDKPFYDKKEKIHLGETTYEVFQQEEATMDQVQHAVKDALALDQNMASKDEKVVLVENLGLKESEKTKRPSSLHADSKKVEPIQENDDEESSFDSAVEKQENAGATEEFGAYDDDDGGFNFDSLVREKRESEQEKFRGVNNRAAVDLTEAIAVVDPFLKSTSTPQGDKAVQWVEYQEQPSEGSNLKPLASPATDLNRIDMDSQDERRALDATDNRDFDLKTLVDNKPTAAVEERSTGPSGSFVPNDGSVVPKRRTSVRRERTSVRGSRELHVSGDSVERKERTSVRGSRELHVAGESVERKERTSMRGKRDDSLESFDSETNEQQPVSFNAEDFSFDHLMTVQEGRSRTNSEKETEKEKDLEQMREDEFGKPAGKGSANKRGRGKALQNHRLTVITEEGESEFDKSTVVGDQTSLRYGDSISSPGASQFAPGVIRGKSYKKNKREASFCGSNREENKDVFREEKSKHTKRKSMGGQRVTGTSTLLPDPRSSESQSSSSGAVGAALTMSMHKANSQKVSATKSTEPNDSEEINSSAVPQQPHNTSSRNNELFDHLPTKSNSNVSPIVPIAFTNNTSTFDEAMREHDDRGDVRDRLSTKEKYEKMKKTGREDLAKNQIQSALMLNDLDEMERDQFKHLMGEATDNDPNENRLTNGESFHRQSLIGSNLGFSSRISFQGGGNISGDSFYTQRTNSNQFRATSHEQQFKGVQYAEDQYQSTIVRDLLISLIGQRSLFMMSSDYEIADGFRIFTMMYQADKKCHEAMFGIARANFTVGRFENAEQWLVLAYQNEKDLAYRVWLGYTYMEMYKRLPRINPRKLKFAKYAVKNLSRCAKDKHFGLYANFGLLYLSTQVHLEKQEKEVAGMRSPAEYATDIKKLYSSSKVQYEGYLAWAYCYLYTEEGKEKLGIKVLQELIAKNPNRPEAQLMLVNHFLKEEEYATAMEQAQLAFNQVSDFQSFGEKLLMTELYAKASFKNGKYRRLLNHLQLVYSECPNFPVLLYLYGKYAIKSDLTEFFGSAIGALQQVMQSSVAKRRNAARFFIGLAYEKLKKIEKAHFYFKAFQRHSKEMTEKIGQQRKSSKQIYVSKFEDQYANLTMRKSLKVQKEVRIALQQFKLIDKGAAGFHYDLDPVNRGKRMSQLPPTHDFIETQQRQQEVFDESSLIQIWSNQHDDFRKLQLILHCDQITNVKLKFLCRAQLQYRLIKDDGAAQKCFNTLLEKYCRDPDVQFHYVRFCTSKLKKGKIDKDECNRYEYEADKLLKLVDDESYNRGAVISTEQWMNSYIAAAKLYFQVYLQMPNKKNMLLKALATLLALKHLLPPVDQQFARVKLPVKLDAFMIDDFDLIDYQGQNRVASMDTDMAFTATVFLNHDKIKSIPLQDNDELVIVFEEEDDIMESASAFVNSRIGRSHQGSQLPKQEDVTMQFFAASRYFKRMKDTSPMAAIALSSGKSPKGKNDKLQSSIFFCPMSVDQKFRKTMTNRKINRIKSNLIEEQVAQKEGAGSFGQDLGKRLSIDYEKHQLETILETDIKAHQKAPDADLVIKRRTSTPMVAIYRYLQEIRRQKEETNQHEFKNSSHLTEYQFLQILGQNLAAEDECVDDVDLFKCNSGEALKDTGFSVSTDAKFYLLIADMCIKAKVYIDLTVQCLSDYLTICGYFKEFIGVEKYQQIRSKVIIKIAMALSQFEERTEAQKLLKSVEKKVKEDFEKSLVETDKIFREMEGLCKGKISHFEAKRNFNLFGEVDMLVNPEKGSGSGAAPTKANGLLLD